MTIEEAIAQKKIIEHIFTSMPISTKAQIVHEVLDFELGCVDIFRLDEKIACYLGEYKGSLKDFLEDKGVAFDTRRSLLIHNLK